MTRSRIILLGALSLIFTLLVLRWSAAHGRLAQDITADDSAYFTDGLRRLQALSHGGISESVRYALRSPPHSPYSSLMAFLGFLILGVRDWVPYFTNVVLVFLLLLLVDHLTRKLDEGRRNALLLVTLAVPFSFTAVHDFRPDFAVALFTAIGVVCGLEWAVAAPPDSTSVRRAFIGGLPFGVAFLVKPSFFPHTAVLSMVPVLFKVMSWSLARSEQPQPISRFIPAGLSYLAGVLLLPLPYYVWNHLSILGYFFSNTGQGADAALWRLQGEAWSVFAIYTYAAGSGIAGMLGNFIFAFVLLSVIGLAVYLRNGNRREALVQAGVLTAIAASLAILVYGRYSNSFFGLTYQILLLCGAIRGLGPHPSLGRRGNNLLFGGLLAFSFWNALVPAAHSYARTLMGVPASDARQALHRIVDVIAENTSADFAAKNRRGNLTVAFAFWGDVNSSNFDWVALKRGYDISMRDYHRVGDPEEILRTIAGADFMVLAKPGTLGVDGRLPSSPLQGRLIDELQKNGSSRVIADIPSEGGGYVILVPAKLRTGLFRIGPLTNPGAEETKR